MSRTQENHRAPVAPQAAASASPSLQGHHGTFSNEAPGNDESELALESDLPTDGRDEVGEAMIRKLPQRNGLSEAPPEPADRK